MPLEPLSLRAYAAHRKRHGFLGGSLQAVQRAIQTERLKTCVVRVRGLIRITDPELADREWAENTDQTRRVSAADGTGLEEDAEDGAQTGFAYWKAKKMELDYRLAAGELVDAADMAAAIATDYSAVRTKVLGLPAKAKQRLPHLTLGDLATLDAIVREALEQLAAGDDEVVGHDAA